MSSERTMRRMPEETGNRGRAERRVTSQIQREVMQLILDRGSPPAPRCPPRPS